MIVVITCRGTSVTQTGLEKVIGYRSAKIFEKQ